MDCEETPGFNSFSNDGSFMENFMKTHKKEKEEPTSTQTSKPLPPLMTKKPLLFKKFAKKKKTPVLGKPAVSGGVFDSDSDEKPQTKEPAIPLAGSIGTASVEGGVPAVVTPPLTATSLSEQAPGSPVAPLTGRKRKRGSRWSDGPPTTPASSSNTSASAQETAPVATTVTSLGESLGQRVGSANSTGGQLSATQLQQIREQIEINKMISEIKAASAAAQYDSDEDTEDGTWEHKKRAQEMAKTLAQARELTEMGKGKHHIGDFLPPKELEKFLEKSQAIKEGRNPDLSDYKDFKLTESNIGFRMLQKAGWDEGKGLGEKQDGITNPINQGKTSFDQAGVGAEVPGELDRDDDAFDTYRKRMMLAYRFRPNPLNNPRRPYY